MSEMSDAVKVAIAKGIKGVADSSDRISKGDHPIDATVHIKGFIRKGEDTESIVAMNVPHWKLISVLLSKLNGVTVDSVIDEMLNVSDAEATRIKEQATTAIQKLKEPTRQIVAGKVTTYVDFDIVEDMSGSVDMQKIIVSEDKSKSKTRKTKSVR